MRHRLKVLLTALVLVPIVFASTAALALTKDDVIQMYQGGVSAQEIIRQIRDSGSTFVMTEADVRELTVAGVPNSVVAEMTMHPPQDVEPLPVVASASDIARLHAAGEPPERITEAIEANPPFGITRDELELLRASGVPDVVIAAAARRALDAPSPSSRTRRAQLQREWDSAGSDRRTARRDPPRRHPRGAGGIEHRAGFSLAGALGVNLCVKDDGADCDVIDPGIALDASIGYRFSQWVSLMLDLGYGGYSLDADGLSATAFSAMATLRAHLRLTPQLDFSPGFGFGFASWKLSDDFGESFSWSTPLAYKLTFELSYRMSDRTDLGFQIAIIAHPDNGDVCYDDGLGEFCEETGDNVNVAERMTLGLRVTHRFD